MSFESPHIPKNIPSNSKWLGGIGAGSWFFIEKKSSFFKIDRFSKSGVLECTGLFEVNKQGFTLEEEYAITYLSHCQMCTIIQQNIIYTFNLYENKNV